MKSVRQSNNKPSNPAAKPSAAIDGRAEAQRLAQKLLKEQPDSCYEFKHIQKLPATKEVLAASVGVQVQFIRVTCELIAGMRKKLGPPGRNTMFEYLNLFHHDHFPYAPQLLSRQLFRKKLPFMSEDLLAMVDRLAHLRIIDPEISVPIVNNVVSAVEEHLENASPGKELRQALTRLQKALNWTAGAAEKKLRVKIEMLLESRSGQNKSLPRVMLQAGEAWSDAAIADLKRLNKEQQPAWLRLLAHCQKSSGSSPSQNWSKASRELLKAVGAKEFKQRALRWFALMNEPRTQRIEKWHRTYEPNPNQLIIAPHSDLLKGMVWCAGLKEDKEFARALTALALSAYRKIPLKGPREVKVGNACVIALGMMPGMEGVYQLGLLKVKVKFGTAQKAIEKALNAAAEREQMPREELEEIGVPAYGLTEVGRSTEQIGDFTAELTVTGTNSTEIVWITSDGKRLTSVPGGVKKGHTDELKELQAAAKDIQRMLPAQRERIDTLFLQQKKWTYAIWRERYLDHPLVGVIARRLLWDFTFGKKTVTGIWYEGRIVDLDLKPIASLDQATVELWHPIDKSTEEIVAWRGWLDAQQIQQPFKQAHREIYVLTDAERNTAVYSNRYAAHILKQHQFNALCALRGWKNKLRLMVDDEYPPASRQLPHWNLRAEFWIEGIGDDYGTDTNDNGVFHHVSTDQVRFYRIDAGQRTAHAGGGGYHPDDRRDDEPVALDQIPPLVLSEIMRDVDLFVGVASVGNDPTWSDGGPEGRYREYWQDVSFGALNATAKTRKEVLQRLVPKLKIAAQCSFEEKFLVVKGSLRTYKIHLGSGNILMSPKDQYLCIVPKQSEIKTGDVFLPFEGDRTLSVILSKVFLLANDAKISDSTILSQIERT